MNKGLLFLVFLTSLILGVAFFPNGATASVIILLGTITVSGILKSKVQDIQTLNFLTNIFVSALLIRILLASVIYGFGLENNFGPDAITYQFWGKGVLRYWLEGSLATNTDYTRSGYGMPFIVAFVYLFTGENPLAVQIVSCILGASIPILSFYTSKEIFNNTKVAKYTAIFVAFFPAMIIWTSQMLKEGFIIFFLILSILAALNLIKNFNFIWVVYLFISFIALAGLRFYIFFIVVVAVFGGFVLSAKSSAESLMSRFIACLLIAVALAYLGVWRISSDQIEKYGNLERVQRARDWAVVASNSAVEEETTDITTAGGALSALPIGLANLLFAPFPWQVRSLTQAMTLPEMLLWWLSIPFLISGLWYTIKTRLKESISVLFFTLILTFSYALYQGNLGTIYRQRAQIQVFLLIFIAVGVVLKLEKMENKRLLLKSQRFPK